MAEVLLARPQGDVLVLAALALNVLALNRRGNSLDVVCSKNHFYYYFDIYGETSSRSSQSSSSSLHSGLSPQSTNSCSSQYPRPEENSQSLGQSSLQGGIIGVFFSDFFSIKRWGLVGREMEEEQEI